MITNKWLFNKLSLISALLVLLGSGCTKNFEEWNTNPNQATAEMLQYDDLITGSLFVQMQKNVFPISQQPLFGDEVYQTMQNLCGDIYSGYMGSSGLWYSNVNNTTYAPIPNWYNQAFDRGFIGILPAWKSIKDVTIEQSAPQKLAIATIVKVEGLHRIADIYGPLPYINFGNGALQNTYDNLKDIYYKFFDELDTAINVLTIFNVQNPNSTPLSRYDFIFNGNVQMWIKFANTLKLRLAMRIVYADPSKAQAEAESAVNSPVGVFTNTSDVALLQHTSNMVYNHPLNIICYNFGDIRMGANMDSYLNGYKDPRLSLYFNKSSAGDYRGIRTGINITAKETYSQGPFSMLNIPTSFPIIWMGPAEAYFLRAEGALRGWNMGGTAQSLYETGIRTSFSYWNAGGVDAYIKDSTSLPAAYTDPQNSGNNISIGSASLSTITIKWKPTASFEENLERIITQKWIAGFPDGQEAWSEFRRTGYPKVFPVVVNNSGGLISTTTQIRRMPFPTTEYSTNPGGVAQGVQYLGGTDNGGTKLWWDKK